MRESSCYELLVVADLVQTYRGFDPLQEMAGDSGRLLVGGRDAAVRTRLPGRAPVLPPS